MKAENEIEDLRQQIKSLQNELKASMRREELLQNPVSTKGSLKQKLKRTKVWQVIADPNSKMGKIARSPRTIYWIARNPSILKEKRQDKQNRGGVDIEEESLFVPIKFFFRDNENRRINLVINKFDDEEIIKEAIELANRDKIEIRIVTCKESSAAMKYKRMVDEKRIPKAKKVSFYSSYDQGRKKEVFELEVGNNDIFITRAWKND